MIVIVVSAILEGDRNSYRVVEAIGAVRVEDPFSRFFVVSLRGKVSLEPEETGLGIILRKLGVRGA